MHSDPENERENNREAQDLPSWFTELTKPYSVSGSTSRQDSYTALNIYSSHVKFTTTILLSILVASLALLTLRQPSGNVAPALEQVVAALLILDAIVGCISVFVVTRYYNVYVSELIAGAQYHYAIGLRSYEWYESLIDMLETANTRHKNRGEGEIHRREFLRQRTTSLNDSHFHYSLIISLISFVCVAIALWLWQFEPFSTTATYPVPWFLVLFPLPTALAYVLLLKRFSNIWEKLRDLLGRGGRHS